MLTRWQVDHLYDLGRRAGPDSLAGRGSRRRGRWPAPATERSVLPESVNISRRQMGCLLFRATALKPAAGPAHTNSGLLAGRRSAGSDIRTAANSDSVGG